jgi:hypothetical protein
MNSMVVNAVAIREDPSQYLIRYRIENGRFVEVLSSVTSCSVLLLGATWKEAQKSAAVQPQYSLIAAILLTAPVDPAQTTATCEGDDLVLRLVKSGGRQLEEALIPVTERRGI